MMCHLTVTASSGPETVIQADRSRRVVMVVLSLLSQVEGIENGKLTLSWGGGSQAVKWALEAHGHDGTGLMERGKE